MITQPKINIVIAVNALGALIDKKLETNVFFMDDSQLLSEGQGTEFLSTKCVPGQTILWTINAIDLQTPAAIKSISFSENELPSSEKDDPYTSDWRGYVPFALEKNKEYKYKIQLQIGEGENSLFSIETASIKCL